MGVSRVGGYSSRSFPVVTGLPVSGLSHGHYCGRASMYQGGQLRWTQCNCAVVFIHSCVKASALGVSCVSSFYAENLTLRSNTSNSYYYSYVQIAILAVARGTIPIVTSNSLNGTTQIHPPNVIFYTLTMMSSTPMATVMHI